MKYLLLIIACLLITMESVSIVEEVYPDIPEVQYTELPVKIFAGEVHYSRIPVEYWEHRIQMIKALGLNTLSVYIMWNYHQVKKGQFDFSTGNRNLPKFLDLAKKYGLYVLIRPGPYVCAQWDYGGMPARLLNIPNLVLRSNNKQFLAETKIYFQALANIFIQYSAKNGGPIILLQIQNEYGFYGKQKSYIDVLRKMWADLKVEIDQYYVDIANNTKVCHWNGANIGINNFKTEAEYQYVRQFEKKGYILAGQDYTGWLTHWGEKWAEKNIQEMEKVFGFLLKNKHSFSMYMIHGGTNFGLTAGANRNSDTGLYEGHITSYDYDAPINEQGSATNKYKFLKELLSGFVEWDVPQIPEPIPIKAIQSFTPTLKGFLFEKLPPPTEIDVPKPSVFQSKNLQMYDQGMVLYTTYLEKKNYYFKIQVHDFAIIYLDGQYFKTISRSQSVINSVGIGCQNDHRCKLDILVQAMGHINFDHAMSTDYKGLYSITDDQKSTFKWTSTKLPIDKVHATFKELQPQLKARVDSPALFEAQITIEDPADTYFNMQQYKKGYVWINGKNLGRYWNIGPQQKLFCPGVWMNKGKNTIQILELLQSTPKPIKGDISRV